MATGRIRRTARRGITAAVLGWLGVAAFSVLMAPSAGAAPSKAVTIEIRNVTPPAASVESGGTVTFVNKIPPQDKGGISIPLVGSFSATVFTDVSVTFFGQKRDLPLDQSASWVFTAPATTGTVAYTYRIVPQPGLAVDVANQVVNTVAGSLPPLPAPAPYVVQTVVPTAPALPSVNLPQLPTVQVPPLGGEVPPPSPPVNPLPTPPTGDPGDGDQQEFQTLGNGYAYDTGLGAPRMSASDVVAAAAFDPSRFFVPGRSTGGPDRGGSGGLAGTYDGASVPVFGQLAGLDGATLDEDAVTEAASESAPAQSLPAAALAAVVALVTVTAALVRTQQAARASR
ncbi:cupredoxin domain-containing protein [Blastococcus deserti]|uniref:CopC domain-containing protein n=1 Tax=Blastococcus deserti TaxID=2259033 RepID=A0ABW4XBQ5_9ACTN